MNRTWFVVAHRAGARILEHAGPGQQLTLVEDIAHEAGRKKSSEIASDSPGMSFSRVGPGRHPYATEESAHERVAANFARELGARLATGRTTNKFNKVVLVAEPRFLGMLRDGLDRQTAAQVVGTVHKDLAHVPEHALAEHLGDAMEF